MICRRGRRLSASFLQEQIIIAEMKMADEIILIFFMKESVI
jgi:hypothetical protein